MMITWMAGSNTSTYSTEKQSWDLGWSYLVESSNSVFGRGGHACDNSDAGIFAFHKNNGNYIVYYRFRPCLVKGKPI